MRRVFGTRLRKSLLDLGKGLVCPENPRFDGTSQRLSVPPDQGSLLPLVRRALRQSVIGVEHKLIRLKQAD